MSDISKKSKTNEMEILNSEVNRLHIIKGLLGDEVQNIEVAKAEKLIVFNEQISNKQIELAKLEAQVEVKKQKVEELNVLISEKTSLKEKMILRLEEKEKELEIKISLVEKNKEENDKLLKNYKQVLIEQDLISKSFEVREKQLLEKEKNLVLKDNNISNSLLEADKEKEKAQKLHLEHEDKLKGLDNMKVNLDAQSKNLDERHVELRVSEQKSKSTLDMSESKLTEYTRKINSLEDREKALAENETDYNKKINLFAQREAEVILRERDCRLRERLLSIRDQENKLNDQSTTIN